MSFEVKYDKNGAVIPSQDLTQELSPQPPLDQPLSSAEEAVQEVLINEQPDQELEVVQPVKQARDPKESFRELRQKAENAERDRDMLLKRLVELESQRNQPVAQPLPVEDDEVTLAPDELAEGKHLSKMGRKIKNLEEQVRKHQQQTQETILETKLKTNYKDFDQVVCRENLDLLKARYPELAETIASSNADLYAKAVSAYSLIKKMGIAPEQADEYSQDRAVIQKNVAKPRSSVSIAPQHGESPLTKANAFAGGLTDDLKKQLRQEMEDARRNR